MDACPLLANREIRAFFLDTMRATYAVAVVVALTFFLFCFVLEREIDALSAHK